MKTLKKETGGREVVELRNSGEAAEQLCATNGLIRVAEAERRAQKRPLI